MALGTGELSPWVWEFGSARIIDNTIIGDGTGWAAGQFLAKEADGEATLCTAGAGNAVAYYALSTVGTETTKVPLLQPGGDTVFAGQLTASTPDQDNINNGGNFIIDGTTGHFTVTETDTLPVTGASHDQVEIVDIWLNKFWYLASHDFAGAKGIVFFKITQDALEANAVTSA